MFSQSKFYLIHLFFRAVKRDKYLKKLFTVVSLFQMKLAAARSDKQKGCTWKIMKTILEM